MRVGTEGPIMFEAGDEEVVIAGSDRVVEAADGAVRQLALEIR